MPEETPVSAPSGHNIWRIVAVSITLVTFVVLSIVTTVVPKREWISGADPLAQELALQYADAQAKLPSPPPLAPVAAPPPDSPTAPGVVDSTLTVDALNTGDIAWVLMSTALVMLMTPGLAFFYGGMVRSKNVISTIMQCYICMGVIAVIWIFFTFSLCFGKDAWSGFIGSPASYYFFNRVGAAPNPEFATTIPFTLFATFQMMFAVLTPALITGSFAERIRFGSFIPFIILWHIIVYCPLAHMTWHPQGIMRTRMVMDFAGGTVVHMSSGWAALVGALYLGPRTRKNMNTAGHQASSVPFVLLGTAMLWFGWFGFNGGSSLGANWLACHAFLTTNVAAASAMITWIMLDYLKGHAVKAVNACAGAVVGLVVITPSCGFVTIGAALIIGCIGSVCSYLMQMLFKKFTHKLDDSLDAFPCHGWGGTVGMVLTALFATQDVNSLGHNGAFYGEGGGKVLGNTLVAVIACVAYICVASLFCYKITDMIIPMRVSLNEELAGLDISQHGETSGHLGITPDMEVAMSKLNNGEEEEGVTPHGNKVVPENAVPPSDDSRTTGGFRPVDVA